MNTERFVSQACQGETCWCGQAAEHKVEEAILFDDPVPIRHPYTTYVCHAHFRQMMGPAVGDA